MKSTLFSKTRLTDKVLRTSTTTLSIATALTLLLQTGLLLPVEAKKSSESKSTTVEKKSIESDKKKRRVTEEEEVSETSKEDEDETSKKEVAKDTKKETVVSKGKNGKEARVTEKTTEKTKKTEVTEDKKEASDEESQKKKKRGWFSKKGEKREAESKPVAADDDDIADDMVVVEEEIIEVPEKSESKGSEEAAELPPKFVPDQALISVLSDVSKELAEADEDMGVEEDSERAIVDLAKKVLDAALAKEEMEINRILRPEHSKIAKTAMTTEAWASGEVKVSDDFRGSVAAVWGKRVNGLLNVTIAGNCQDEKLSNGKPVGQFIVVVSGSSPIKSGFDIQSRKDVEYWIGKLAKVRVDAACCNNQADAEDQEESDDSNDSDSSASVEDELKKKSLIVLDAVLTERGLEYLQQLQEFRKRQAALLADREAAEVEALNESTPQELDSGKNIATGKNALNQLDDEEIREEAEVASAPKGNSSKYDEAELEEDLEELEEFIALEQPAIQDLGTTNERRQIASRHKGKASSNSEIRSQRTTEGKEKEDSKKSKTEEHSSASSRSEESAESPEADRDGYDPKERVSKQHFDTDENEESDDVAVSDEDTKERSTAPDKNKKTVQVSKQPENDEDKTDSEEKAEKKEKNAKVVVKKKDTKSDIAEKAKSKDDSEKEDGDKPERIAKSSFDEENDVEKSTTDRNKEEEKVVKAAGTGSDESPETKELFTTPLNASASSSTKKTSLVASSVPPISSRSWESPATSTITKQPSLGAVVHLPARAMAGKFLTVAVCSKEGKPEPSVELSFNGATLSTNANGQAIFMVPEDATPGRSLHVSLAARPELSPEVVDILQPLVVSQERQTPQVDKVTKVVTSDGILQIDGHDFFGIANKNRIDVDSIHEAKVLAASPVQLLVSVPDSVRPGSHSVNITTQGMKSNPGQFDYIKAEIEPDKLSKKILKNLVVTVKGTNKPVHVKIVNRTPDVLKIAKGNNVTITTSGGSENCYTLGVKQLKKGDYKIDTKIEM